MGRLEGKVRSHEAACVGGRRGEVMVRGHQAVWVSLCGVEGLGQAGIKWCGGRDVVDARGEGSGV